MRKKLRVLLVVGSFALLLAGCGGSETSARPPEPGTPNMGDWCYAAPWIRKATNLQYYRWRDTTHSREEVAQATDYGGWLMVWYQDAVEKGEMPSGVDEDFRAWMLHINRMQEEGHKIGDYTDAVLAHCRE